MALDLSKFVARFVEEAREHFSRLEEGLSALEQGQGDAETINQIFRSAHTIKGSSRMLKLMGISDTAHKLEDVLGGMREGSLAFSPALGQVLRRGVDALSAMVDVVDGGGELGSPDADLVALLEQASRGELVGEAAAAPVQPAPPSPAPISTPAAAAVDTPAEGAMSAQGAAPGAIKAPDTVRIKLAKLDELIKLMGEMVASHARLEQRSQEMRRLDRQLATLAARDEAGLNLIRAEAHRLHLQLRDDVLEQQRFMNELHDKTLVMRMLPLTIVFDPAARLVRDLARNLGREVEVAVSGAQIELDRQMIDRLSDPVVHLLRNAVDHGLEPPEGRIAAGKPRQGRIHLSARQDGGWVVLEVGDDGKGLPLAAIRAKAVKRGLLTPEAASALSDAEATDLIFLPGFSTSPIITEISGRGVGMDVVKKTIVDDLRGVIRVESRAGIGSTFVLRLPLSLAVMRVLLCDVEGFPCGLTAQYIHGLFRFTEADFMIVAQRRAVIIHNEFVPVVPLAELIGLPPGRFRPAGAAAEGPHRPGAGTLLVVVQVRNEKVALQVSDLIDERDMVIKPVPEEMRHLGLVDGMVMTGRNELVCVLHVPELMERARAARGRAVGASAGQPQASRHVLVVDDSLNTREIEKDVLEAHGFRVTLAEDGLDGLQKARSGDFDAILTDVEMPGLDGFALTERLRQEERYKDRPIVIITSREKEEDKRRGILVGADAYIVKGDFEQSSLIATLNNLLG